jgi:hypothetical protein
LDTLLVIVVGICALFWGGYVGAKRYPRVGALLALLLLVVSGALARLRLDGSGLGEGAPSGAVAFIGFVWLAEVVGILISATLLVAGWRANDSPLSKTLLFFVCVPVAAYAVFQALPAADRSRANAPTGPTAKEPTGTRKDGYIWALDANFLSEADCHGASPEFVAGCKEGVVKNRAREAK